MALSKPKWNEEELVKAIEDIKDNKLSYRKAELKYGIPKSTLCDYVSGKVEVGRRQGPQPVLSHDEEKALVLWATEMTKIGYGQTRRQICETVKKILDKDGRQNPFVDNRPGKDWWYGFLSRNKLTIRRTSALESYRASACTKEVLEKWYTDFEQFLLCNNIHNKPDRIWNCDESGFPLCPKSGKVLAPVGIKTVYATSSAQKSQITNNNVGRYKCLWSCDTTYAHIPWGKVLV